ncbi:MAG: ISNCY family transposase [Treponema sp.]|nr:ISNCY family transposase [Treponema sp.]
MKKNLTKKQKYRKKSVQKIISKKMTTRQLAMETGLTIRTIQKWVKAYKEKGDLSLVHGNTGKKRVSTEREKLKKRIIDIFLNTRIENKNPFEDVTYTFFKIILEEKYGIKASVTWVKKILNEMGYVTPIKHRVKKNTEVHLMRPRKESEGELVQADGTPYDWFKDGHNYCIQGFIDDATGLPIGLYMTKNECTLGYVEAFRNMASKKGLPQAIYPDKAGIFFVNQKTKTEEKHLTQFGLMMENIGIDMFPAHSPQAKGRIERFWETIQHRLPNLFILLGINNIEDANVFLRDKFPKIYKKWFYVKPKNNKTAFVKADMKEVNSILKATFPGTVDRGGIFVFKGYRFFCPELANKKILINLNEKEGMWVTEINSEKRHYVQLVETDTTGTMPEVTKLLIERVFLKNAKPKFREVYIDIDDVVLSEIKPKRTA